MVCLHFFNFVFQISFGLGGIFICWSNLKELIVFPELTIWKARSWRLRCWQSLFLLKAVKKNLLHASPLAFGFWLAVFGFPWLVEPSPQTLHLPSHSALPVCMSVSKFPLFIRTPISYCQASVCCSVLSHHNKDLEWRTLKPSACHSSRASDRPCYSSQVSNRPL